MTAADLWLWLWWGAAALMVALCTVTMYAATRPGKDALFGWSFAFAVAAAGLMVAGHIKGYTFPWP